MREELTVEDKRKIRESGESAPLLSSLLEQERKVGETEKSKIRKLEKERFASRTLLSRASAKSGLNHARSHCIAPGRNLVKSRYR